jgi:hypothetical protein
MKRHEVMMRVKLEEAEKVAKGKAVDKQQFFAKDDKGKIAAPIGKR